MKIKHTNSVEIGNVYSCDIDVFLCSAGYEERATNIAEHLKEKLPAIPFKYCIGFQEKKVLSRNKNDFYFKNAGFEIIIGEGDSTGPIEAIFNNILNLDKDKGEINVLVDYSCMTRIWYADILTFFNEIKIDKKICIFFSYSYSKFTAAPLDVSNNIHVGPIKGFNSLSIPFKPTALIIGLGYEKNRAFGLTEYLDAETYVFYSDNGKGKEFAKEVEIVNSELLSRIEPKNLFRYPINDLRFTEFLLTSLCNDLKDKFRIILAPCGPKPFTLICLIVSLKFKTDFIDVWRISPGINAEPIDKTPDGEMNFYKVEYE